MAKNDNKNSEKPLAGAINEDLFWEFMNARINMKIQVKDAVAIAAKLFINEFNKSKGKEAEYDVSIEFSTKSNETK